jgi:hypothetical protein
VNKGTEMRNLKLLSLCDGMSEMAATHPNDKISNALARVSRKIESIGTSKFAPELDELDMKIVQFYLVNK